jgi:O-antigen/teichoic acid export membrane protein
MSILSKHLSIILNRLEIGRTIATDGFWSFLLRAMYIGLTFLSTVLLARILGASGYGIYSYALSIATLLAMPIQSGLPSLAMRETAQGIAQNRPDLVKGAWNWSTRIIFIVSLVIIILIGPVLLIWQGGINDIRGQTLLLALALIPVIALANLWGAILRGLKEIKMGLLPELIIRPGFLLILIISTFFFTTKNPISAPVTMAVYLGASIITLWISTKLINKYTPNDIRKAQATTNARGWILSGVTFAFLTGFITLNTQVGTIILGIFKSPDIVGQYRVAVQVATLASFGLQAVNQVVAPRFAELWARNEHRKLQQLVTKSSQIILIFNLILTIIFILLGKSFFIIVFGDEFKSAYLPLLILLLGQMVNSATGSVGFLLNMTGNEVQTANNTGVAAIINIVISLALVPILGMIGAAIASASSMTIWNILHWWRVYQKLGINSLAFNIFNKERYQ